MTILILIHVSFATCRLPPQDHGECVIAPSSAAPRSESGAASSVGKASGEHKLEVELRVFDGDGNLDVKQDARGNVLHPEKYAPLGLGIFL